MLGPRPECSSNVGPACDVSGWEKWVLGRGWEGISWSSRTKVQNMERCGPLGVTYSLVEKGN